MNPERFRQVYELYHAALERQPGERAELLAQADPEVRREVESLLEQPGSGLLDRPAWEGAANLLSDPTRTQFSPGTQLGPYRIEAPLGVGGMGQVYRAEDTRLGRAVAIKISLKQFSGRFKREARAISALNHPHICTLYDMGPNYLVMEFVEGETLAARLKKGPLPVELVLRHGAEITDALAEAHSRGIIHRDLKPGNVMLTKAGVKVLDFGLAKFTQPDVAEVKRDEIETDSHVVMGTPAYMAPEQALGRELDERADLFSFGVVLYEMATGKRPFQGGTPTAMIDAILHQVPAPPAQVNPSIPPGLGQIIERALEKDLEVRYQTASGIRADLKRLIRDMDSGRVVSAPLALVTPRRRWSYIVAGAVILTAVSAGMIWWRTRTQISLPQPVLMRLTSDSGLTTDPALSPDGKLLAYASDRSGEGHLDIYVKQVGGGEPLRLTRDPADDHEPVFSPDGTTLAFRSKRDGGGIYLVPALGGPARRIAPDGRRPQFSPDGRWIAYWVGDIGGASLNVRDSARIYVVAAAGGPPRQLQPGFIAAAYPTWAPDSEHLLFLGSSENSARAEESVDWWVTPLTAGRAIRTGALDATRRAQLGGDLQVYPAVLGAPAWEPDGNRLVFSARAGDTANLWRIGISPRTFKVIGPPQRMTSGPTREDMPAVASEAGRIRVAFRSVGQNLSIWSLPIEPNEGKVVGKLQRLTQEAADDFFPSLSRDGSKMVFVSSRSGGQEVWIRDLRTSENFVLTASRSNTYLPSFSPDGSKVSFNEEPSGNIYIVPASGGAPETACEGCGEATDWTSDGKRIIGNGPDGRAWILDLASRRKTNLFATGHWIANLYFSPDNRWLTFLDGTAGRMYIAPLGEGPIGDSSWIDMEYGAGQWSPDGKLFYGISERDGYTCIWARRLDPATKRPAGAPFAVFHSHNARLSLANSETNFDGGRQVAGGKMVFTMGERTGNIWMAEWKER